MIGQFKQVLFFQNFTLQDQGKDDPTDTLQNIIKFWIIIISNAEGPVPDKLYEYDYDGEGLDHSVRVAEIFPEVGDFKNILDIRRCK